MSAKKKYKEWTLIDWDGNPELGLKCYRKSFGRGHVSVGVGPFLSVVFSFGANSEDSHSCTRWNGADKPPKTEAETTAAIDRQWGLGRRNYRFTLVFPIEKKRP